MFSLFSARYDRQFTFLCRAFPMLGGYFHPWVLSIFEVLVTASVVIDVAE